MNEAIWNIYRRRIWIERKIFLGKFPLFEDKYWREISLHVHEVRKKKYSNFSNECWRVKSSDPNDNTSRFCGISGKAASRMSHSRGTKAARADSQRWPTFLAGIACPGCLIRSAKSGGREWPLFRLERYYRDRNPFKKPDRLIILNVLAPFSLPERKEKLPVVLITIAAGAIMWTFRGKLIFLLLSELKAWNWREQQGDMIVDGMMMNVNVLPCLFV